jgi:hypothetical protein
MDVGGWLRGLGLGQYEALFRASEIDADILPELTDVDLEKLGVRSGTASGFSEPSPVWPPPRPRQCPPPRPV